MMHPILRGPRGLFLKNTVAQYGLQAAKYLFPLLTIPYLTRVLGYDAYAVRAYVLAGMTFVQVFLDFGFTAYGTRAIAESKDHRKEGQIVAAVIILRIVLAVACAFVLGAIGGLIPLFSANMTYLFIAYIGVCCKAMLPDFVFQGHEDMGFITKRFVATQALSAAFIFLLIGGPEDLIMVPVIETVAALAALCWSWADVVLKRAVRPTPVSAEQLKSAFGASGVFFLSSASTTVYTSLTTLFIGVLVEDSAQVAYWSLAMTAVSAIQSLYTPVTNSLYPHMVKRRDRELAKRLLFWGTLAALAGCLLFACLADSIMFILGGPEYVEGSYVITMVSPVLLFSYPAMLVGFPVLAAVGEEKRLTASSLCSALFHILGLVVLTALGWFTIPAVALLRCCTELLLMILRLSFAKPYIVQKGNGPCDFGKGSKKSEGK